MGHMQHSHFSGIVALLGARTNREVAVDDAYLGSKLGARDGRRPLSARYKYIPKKIPKKRRRARQGDHVGRGLERF